MDAAWIITNIVSGNKEQTEQAVEAGIIPPLVEVLQQTTTNDELFGQVCSFCFIVYLLSLLTNILFHLIR